jgi:D-tyrosyl-tRNA(Tyr) deacylase
VRAVIQRVTRASVTVSARVTGAIERGLLVLLGAGAGDTSTDLQYIVDKTVNLRIFPDEAGKMNRSLLDVGGGVLVVSQFTLYGDVRKGRRPSFDSAAPPALAEQLYESFCDKLRALGLTVATGRFRADMRVHSEGDGPVTILIDSERLF